VESDPSFRLKVFVVIAGVLGVFLVAFVAQRVWYWLKTRKREDVETSRLAPIIDFSLLGLGGIVIWLALEGLVLSVHLGGFAVQPPSRQKIAEIEVGRIDAANGQLTLLFYPVDAAGQRRREYNVPVFTAGRRFELAIEVFDWRWGWQFLGEKGFYQYISLGGTEASTAAAPFVRDLSIRPKPGGVGGAMFLGPSLKWQAKPSHDVKEGDVYEVFLSGDQLELRLRDGAGR